MTRWTMGEAEIEKLIADRHLQKVQGGQANGEHLIEKAARTLTTAAGIAADDPDNAYVLAYDAARYAGTALPAQQGLRPTTSGGHYAVEQALRAQFGSGFHAFAAMRRRRHELEYPSGPGEATTPDEAIDTIGDAQELPDTARQLLPCAGSSEWAILNGCLRPGADESPMAARTRPDRRSLCCTPLRPGRGAPARRVTPSATSPREQPTD